MIKDVAPNGTAIGPKGQCWSIWKAFQKKTRQAKTTVWVRERERERERVLWRCGPRRDSRARPPESSSAAAATPPGPISSAPTESTKSNGPTTQILHHRWPLPVPSSCHVLTDSTTKHWVSIFFFYTKIGSRLKWVLLGH